MPVVPTAPPSKLEGQDQTLTDLTIIGVPPEFQSQWPTVPAYPSKFSDEGFHVWQGLLNDQSFTRLMTTTGSKDAAWHMTIHEWLHRCELAVIKPFPDNTPTAGTAFVHEQARRGRIFLVDYCNEIGLFEKVKVWYPHREYIRTDNRIIIYSWARMFPISDVTFPNWLTSLSMPRFIKHTRGRMVATIRPGVRLWIDCLNLKRISVGQEIDVTGTIDIPGNPAPTRQEVDEFLDARVWLPIVRSIRFDFVTNRIF
jgi:hypothetical protein